MKWHCARFAVLSLSVLALAAGPVPAGPPAKSLTSFGFIEVVTPEAARLQAEAWFAKAIHDPARRSQFEYIWSAPDRTLPERVTGTLLLDPAAEKLLNEARTPQAPAPTAVPALLQDPGRLPFYRNNLAVAYARILSNRRVYEEALAVLQLTRPEDVIDPATYLFHRAVAEYSLLQKDNARRSLGRLLDEVQDAPERYKTVAALMLLDMLTWKEKDLSWIARKMDNSGRRLELARGGPVTQKIQRDIVNRLDELIKELENKQKQAAAANNGGCPDGGQPDNQPGGGTQPNSPMRDSKIANQTGPGSVDSKRLKKISASWGSLPEKERRKIIQDLTRGMSNRNAQAIENYFKRLADVKRKDLPRR